MRVASYLRCSTTEQNVNLQRDAVAALCERHADWQVIEYVDHGISGAKDNRPELNRLMADCRRGRIDRVIVWKFDRLARSVSHLLRVMEELQSLNIDFASVTESIDTSTPVGKMTFTVLAAVAELERSLIRERCRAGQQAAKARGKHIGRSASYTSCQAAQIAVLRNGGASVRTIAAQIGLGRGTVQRILSASV